ncbi:MAG: fructosamine kinase family protein [Halovenus sp.]
MDDDTLATLAAVLETGVESTAELSGGNVGTVYRIETADGRTLAAKVGDTPLSIEARMLEYLDRESPVPIPTVHFASDNLLVLEYVEGDGQWTVATERDVAEYVAALHGCSADAYGFPLETLSGPFFQSNPWTDSWIEFFRESRLLAFAERAHEERTLPAETLTRVRTLADRLNEWLVEPDEPALIHGDLWPGNLIVDDESLQAVLDPAIYFGHDELELAYAASSFGDVFFERYRERRGIDSGFEQRRQVYDAFHTLENVRFFGRERLDALHELLDELGV